MGAISRIKVKPIQLGKNIRDRVSLQWVPWQAPLGV